MKKRVFEISMAVLLAVTMPGCAFTGEKAEQMTDESLEGQKEYGAADSSSAASEKAASVSYELKAAVCAALISGCGSDYSKAEYVIPEFHILDVNDALSGDILVWGDFWRYAYQLEGDTLVSVSGEDVSGCMHLQKQGREYLYSSLDVPAVGSTKEKTEQDIFGTSYQSFLEWRNDYENQEETRAQLIADYAAAFGIPAEKYSDQSWRSAELPDPSPDSDNIFLYLLKTADTEDGSEVVLPEPQTADAPESVPEDGTGIYVVVKGDMLERIARRYGLTTMELAEPNRVTIFRNAHAHGIRSNALLKCADYIYPGEVLIIPAAGTDTSKVVQGRG